MNAARAFAVLDSLVREREVFICRVDDAFLWLGMGVQFILTVELCLDGAGDDSKKDNFDNDYCFP